MIDLSKCTELVNGWPIVYGPERISSNKTYPWCAVIANNSGDWEVLSFTEDGCWGANTSYDLKLPEPEWVYGSFVYQSGNIVFCPLPEEKATHRYQAGKYETMEKIDE